MNFSRSSLFSGSFVLINVIALGYLLVIGKAFLMPVVMAALFSFLVLVMSRAFDNKKIFGITVQRRFGIIISLIGLLFLFWLFGVLIHSDVQFIASHLADYQNMGAQRLAELSAFLPAALADSVNSFSFDGVSQWIPKIIGAFAEMTGKSLLVLVYTIFILLEYKSLKEKILRLFVVHGETRDQAGEFMGKVGHQILTYLKVKTLASLTTAILVSIPLLLIDIKTPMLFIVMTFVLNFIPSVGSLIAIAVTTLAAFLQFGFAPVTLLVLICMVVANLSIGTFLEPRISGSSLNLSPFVFIVALALSGAVWGPVGMLLSIPALIIIRAIGEEIPRFSFISMILSGKTDQADK